MSQVDVPITLYIHFPWCIKKCPYCDFNSHTLKTELPESDYIQALLTDFELSFTNVAERDITSIFLGGGTPSLFSPEAMGYLLEGLYQRAHFTNDLEITLEANPGTTDAARFKGYREVGINRLSIGVQSFADDKLRTLGRIHDAKQAIQAVKSAKAAGFDNINIDLMHTLPNQTIAQALQDLTTAIALEPTHLSWYQLTLEPNTLFYQQPPKLPDEETNHAICEQGQTLLVEHGFTQYEVSAYQRGQPCYHNLNYWQFGDYLGIGAGAHSKLTTYQQGKRTIKRIIKSRHPKQYLNHQYVVAEKSVETADLPFEFMMNVLRLNSGVPKDLFQQRTGLTLDLIQPMIQKAYDLELLEPIDTQIRSTVKGLRYLNDLLGLFMSYK